MMPIFAAEGKVLLKGLFQNQIVFNQGYTEAAIVKF